MPEHAARDEGVPVGYHLGMLATLMLSCSLALPGMPQTVTGFVDKEIQLDGETYRYQVYLPADYDAGKPWPVMVFLNGKGECGRDGNEQVSVGLGEAIRRAPERWPFVVVFPQKPDSETQWGDHEDLVLATLAATEKEYAIDEERRVLTGLSQGGSGSWQIGSAHPEMWRAVAPICGYREGDWSVKALAETPVWAFHGDADDVVPLRASEELCKELRKAGGAPHLTIYPRVQHNSWDRAYQESPLAEWCRLALREPLGARLLADHEGVKTKLTLRSGARSRVLEGDAAWSAVQRLVRAGAMDALRPEAAKDAAVRLHLEARSESAEWTRHGHFELKTPAAKAILDEIEAPDPSPRKR